MISGFLLSPEHTFVDFSFYKDHTLLLLQQSLYSTRFCLFDLFLSLFTTQCKCALISTEPKTSLISLIDYGETLIWNLVSTSEINAAGGILPFFRNIKVLLHSFEMCCLRLQ
jgi:hypothetical protein